MYSHTHIHKHIRLHLHVYMHTHTHLHARHRQSDKPHLSPDRLSDGIREQLPVAKQGGDANTCFHEGSGQNESLHDASDDPLAGSQLESSRLQAPTPQKQGVGFLDSTLLAILPWLRGVLRIRTATWMSSRFAEPVVKGCGQGPPQL